MEVKEMYTKKERDYYNQNRERACQRLGITKNHYNWYRKQGNLLHQVYEDNCNGIYDIENEYERACDILETKIKNKAINQNLYVYFQTDPRGATIYLDKEPIPYNNYTQAVCIY